MNQMINSVKIGIRLVLLLFIAFNSYAAMYKWVDEDGNTHYSEKPPAGDIDVQTIKPPPKVDTEAANQELANKQEQLKQVDENRSKQAEEEAALQQQAAIQKKNCETAQKNLATINANPRVYSTDEQGNRYKVGEDERQQKIAAAKKAIAEYCK